MVTRGRVPPTVFSLATQRALTALHAAFAAEPGLDSVQVTFTNLHEPERLPTIDMIRRAPREDDDA